MSRKPPITFREWLWDKDMPNIAVLIGFVLFWLSGLIIGYLRYAKEIPW